MITGFYAVITLSTRVQKYSDTLMQLDAQLSEGGESRPSKLEQKWESDSADMKKQLQKHREGAISRYSALHEERH